MQLEITTPEKVLLDQEVNSVTLPGTLGQFQILDHHAPIVSTLQAGHIVFDVKGNLDKAVKDNFIDAYDSKLALKIKSGVVEMKNNKAIVLVD